MSHPRLAVFARQANGQVAPLRVIEGQKTGLSRSGHGVFLDAEHDEIFVPSNQSSAIVVYGREQKGNTPPKRTIQGLNTHLDSPQGVAVDDEHDELVVANDNRFSILVFDRRAEGNANPLREIIGPLTGINTPEGIVVDPEHDEIVLADEGKPRANPAIPPSLRVFRRTDNGNVAPIRVIVGPHTGLVRPRQLQLDAERDELVLADRTLVQEFIFDPNGLNGFIAVWNRADGGQPGTPSADVPPKKIIRGPQSQLTSPRAVYVDAENDEIGAGDTNTHAILVYPRSFDCPPDSEDDDRCESAGRRDR